MKAIFVGSFDPFHEGHRSVVLRAVKLFDTVVIGIGVNPQKHYMYSVEERTQIIADSLAGIDGIEIDHYSDLTIDFARRKNADYIVKGVRNAEDFVYEQQQALWNKQHSGLETILLLAEPGMEDISSTKIKESLNS